MADKIVIPIEVLKNMIFRMNSKEINIAGLETETGLSRKAIGRRIREAGYIYDKSTGTYSLIGEELHPVITKPVSNKVIEPIKISVKTISDGPILSSIKKEETANMDEKKVVGRPKATEELEKHTYALPKDLVKAMKRKAVEEDKTVVEVMREILKAGIEARYFDKY